MNDPFCSKEGISDTIFYKGKSFMALYNIRPVIPGHSLVIPIRHVTRITELTEEEAMDMHRTMGEVIPALIRFYGAEDNSYNLSVQAGPSSGRTIDHLHVHVIPRRPDDRYRGKGVFNVDISESLENLGSSHVEKEVERLRKYFKHRLE